MIKNKVDNFPKRHWIVNAYCLPADLLCWIIVIILWLVSGNYIYWNNGLWVTIIRKSVLGRTIFHRYGGGTLGHGGWLSADLIGGKLIDTGVEYHEHIHVEQFEVVVTMVLMVLSVIGGVCVYLGCFSQVWYWLLGIWVLSGGIGLVSGFLVAYLRGEDVYMGSAHEESAYSQEDQYVSKH